MSQFETHTNTSEPPYYVMEYPALVDTVQLSVTRLLDIEGSIEARSFKEVQASIPPHQEHLMDRIGELFDKSLISFVTASLVNRRKSVLIRVEASEGFDGWLPWEEKLIAHAEMLAAAGITRQAKVIIERYKASQNVTQFAPLPAEQAETPQAA